MASGVRRVDSKDPLSCLGAHRAGVEAKVIEDAGFDFPKPRIFGRRSSPLLEAFTGRTTAILLDIANPGFFFAHRHLLAPDFSVLAPPGIELERLPVSEFRFPRSITQINAPVCYLSNTLTENYHHWIYQCLASLPFYRERLGDLGGVRFYLGEDSPSELQIGTLGLLGIRPGQIVSLPCRSSRMLALFWKREDSVGTAKLRGDTVRWLRESLKSSVSGGSPELIYVGRGRARRRVLINENEILDALLPLGFVKVEMDGLSFAEQGQIFAGAKAIVAPHGAALTNLLHCGEGARIFEIFPGPKLSNCYFQIASYLGLSYAAAVGDAVPSDAARRNWDFTLDPAIVREGAGWLLSN